MGTSLTLDAVDLEGSASGPGSCAYLQMFFINKLGLLILCWVRVYHCREVLEQSLLSFAEENSLGIAGRREEMREERIVRWIIQD